MRKRRGFTLLEMMAVVVIMMIMLGVAGLALGNSRPSVKVKRDSANLVAFLRNMWDYSKSSGTALILIPNFAEGGFRYTDPRTGLTKDARLSEDVVLLALQVNDRIYSRFREPTIPEDPEEQADDGGNPKPKPPKNEDAEEPVAAREEPLFISEGRGVTTLAVLIGRKSKDDVDTYLNINLAKLNLITGKGEVVMLEQADYEELLRRSQEQRVEVENAEAAGEMLPVEEE